eukprot:972223_1
MDQFYSFFRIVMTAPNHKDNWELHCSGMELYGDLMDCTESESFTKTAFATHGGTIALISDSSIINYGNITSNGAIGGFINIQCTVLKNFGRIEAKNNGRIAIQCHSIETVSDIIPKPLLHTPWKYLILDSKHQFVQLDSHRIPNTERDDFITVAENAKYKINYFDTQHVKRFVDEINHEKKDDTQGALQLIPVQQNPLYSSIEVMVAVLEDPSKSEYCSFVPVKVFPLSINVYHIEQSIPLQIDYKFKVQKFDIKSRRGGAIEIHSKSAIIIQKNGAINANDCMPFGSFKYQSDFDKNGIFYGIGTRFGTKKYENPAVCGLVDVTPSSAMYEGEPYSFIGRDSVRAWTNNEEGSFFSVDLKNYKVRPHAYTLKNYNKSEFALKS